MGHTLLLTGRPGIGKTTVIKTVVETLGEQAGGFYTEEIRGPGGRKGFRLVTLEGQEVVMAHVTLKGKGRPRVGRYGVDAGAIERVGVTALRQAMQKRQIVVIDEIGKMGGPYTVVATAMAKPNPWVDSLKAMPQVEVWEVTAKNRDGMVEAMPQVEVWEVTAKNRDRMVERVIKWLKR